MVDSRRTDPAQIQLGAPQLQWIQSSTNGEHTTKLLVQKQGNKAGGSDLSVLGQST